MRLVRILAGLLVAAGLAVAACSPINGIEAALALGDLAAGDGPSLYKDLRPSPRRAPVAYSVAGRDRRADLYRPAEGAPRAALVLVPGVTPTGKDDPRLVAFATTLARARFLVLVPDIERLRALRVGSADAVDIADAVRYLAGDAGEQGAGAVGLVAISYAAGPALVAASGPAGAGLRFVLTVGGYYDMTALVTYVTTGFYRGSADAAWERGRPNELGRWLFLESNAHHVPEARDRVLLMAVAGRKRRDAAADIADLAAPLGIQGRAVLALLDNRDPDRVPALIAALPAPLRQEMAALDPSRTDLAALRAHLLLVHGRDDPIIPWTQSAALAAAVGPERADLFVADRLAHVDLGPGGLGDAFALWRAVWQLLDLRDAMKAPRRPAAAGDGAPGGL